MRLPIRKQTLRPRLGTPAVRTRAALAPVLGLLLLATAAACGGDDSGDGVASAGGSGDSITDDGDSDSGGGGGGGDVPEEDTRLEFAKCMRENGVEEYPDPDPNSNTFTMKGPEEYGVDKETFDAALDACKDLTPGGGEPPELTADDIKKLREFTQCMREEGIEDMADPEADGSLSVPEGITPNDSEFQAAMKECRDLIAGLPLMMKAGPGPGGGQ